MKSRLSLIGLMALVVAICVSPVSGAETFKLALFDFTDTHGKSQYMGQIDNQLESLIGSTYSDANGYARYFVHTGDINGSRESAASPFSGELFGYKSSTMGDVALWNYVIDHGQPGVSSRFRGATFTLGNADFYGNDERYTDYRNHYATTSLGLAATITSNFHARVLSGNLKNSSGLPAVAGTSGTAVFSMTNNGVSLTLGFFGNTFLHASQKAHTQILAAGGTDSLRKSIGQSSQYLDNASVLQTVQGEIATLKGNGAQLIFGADHIGYSTSGAPGYNDAYLLNKLPGSSLTDLFGSHNHPDGLRSLSSSLSYAHLNQPGHYNEGFGVLDLTVTVAGDASVSIGSSHYRYYGLTDAGSVTNFQSQFSTDFHAYIDQWVAANPGYGVSFSDIGRTVAFNEAEIIAPDYPEVELPEPGVASLLGMGLASLFMFRRSRRG